MCTRTQEEGAVTPQEGDPDLPVSVQESPVEAAAPSAVACCRVGGTEWGSVCSAGDLLKELAIIFITSTVAWPRVK